MNKYARWIALALVTLSVVPVGGCRICADCQDRAYPAYGGAWQRTRRDSGRVASVFDPAGAQSPELVEREQPPTPDALERERQKERDGGFDEPDRGFDMDSGVLPKDFTPGTEKRDDLLERKLDDIQSDKEDDLRERKLDDININVIPKGSVPPTLR